MMMHSRIIKLFNCSLMRLKANMQSTSERDRNTRLRRIVIERILISNPCICAAIDDFRLMEWVTVVSNWLPYLSIETPRIRKDMPVKERTH